jgi:hypothetical protein
MYFGLAFGLSWVIGGIALLVGLWIPDSRALSTSGPLYYLAGYSVSLAGIALTAKYEGAKVCDVSVVAWFPGALRLAGI